MIGALSSIPGIGTGTVTGAATSLGGLPIKSEAAAASPQASFAAALGNLGNNAMGALQNAEQLSVKALQGETDTRAVVDAVMSAEQALNSAIAIRDKIVTAYLEISRMAI